MKGDGKKFCSYFLPILPRQIHPTQSFLPSLCHPFTPSFIPSFLLFFLSSFLPSLASFLPWLPAFLPSLASFLPWLPSFLLTLASYLSSFLIYLSPRLLWFPSLKLFKMYDLLFSLLTTSLTYSTLLFLLLSYSPFFLQSFLATSLLLPFSFLIISILLLFSFLIISVLLLISILLSSNHRASLPVSSTIFFFPILY